MGRNPKNLGGSGVDIVVLNCNNLGYIEPCLESIIENTDGRFRLIVVDQNSTDGSKEWLVKSRKASHLILNDRNTGAWEGRNQGIRASKHDWIMFFDSDMEVRDPNWLDKMWNYTNDSTIGIIESRLQNWDDSFSFGGIGGGMVRRTVFDEVGLFDKHFMIGGDIDFWIRFSWYGDFKVAFCDDTDIYHHCGRTINPSGGSQSSSPMHVHYRINLPRHIYTERFIGETEGAFTQRRLEEERKRGWRQ